MALFQCVLAVLVAAGVAVQPQAPVRRHREQANASTRATNWCANGKQSIDSAASRGGPRSVCCHPECETCGGSSCGDSGVAKSKGFKPSEYRDMCCHQKIYRTCTSANDNRCVVPDCQDCSGLERASVETDYKDNGDLRVSTAHCYKKNGQDCSKFWGGKDSKKPCAPWGDNKCTMPGRKGTADQPVCCGQPDASGKFPPVTASASSDCFGQAGYDNFDWANNNTCEKQPCNVYGTSDPYHAYCLKMACANTQRDAWCAAGGNSACSNQCGKCTSQQKECLASPYTCDKTRNFIPGMSYDQITLTDNCPNCDGNPKYGAPMTLDRAVAYCKSKCDDRSGCTGFFFQKHGNGHEICGFYKTAISSLIQNTDTQAHQYGAICKKN